MASFHYTAIINSLNSAIVLAREGLSNVTYCVEMPRRSTVQTKHIAGQKWENRQWGKGLHPGRCNAGRGSCQFRRKGERQMESFIVKIHLGIPLQGHFIYAAVMSKSPFCGRSIHHFFILWQKVLCHSIHLVLIFCAVLPKEDSRNLHRTEESDLGDQGHSVASRQVTATKIRMLMLGKDKWVGYIRASNH